MSRSIVVAAMAAMIVWPLRVSVQQLPTVTPTAGITIDQSTKIAPGRYRLAAPASQKGSESAVIRVRGENTVLDLTGVTIEGGDPVADPDGYEGIGILVDGGRGVTIRGGNVRGFKVALLARKSPALHVSGFDGSYNWKARLYSGLERESLVDWLSHHDNEKDEWLRYGAAIYLAECDDAEIDNNRVVQGQNGLMITRSARVKVWNNTFSWLSGLGIGLYRTIESSILHNRLDWNVRGYSHGFYNRGQDSAAILMYEQSSKNVVAYNSATHGGDGVFLWAGQSTMDTGRGGSNDNMFFGNDFSHAVANGIEATFSRNQFIRNRIDECWHGIWAGYSYDSIFRDNSFAGNDEGIAIEHGQNITIADNTFAGDQIGVRLWANASQDPNWGYPKSRDTRSREYVITQNRFSGLKTAISATRTANVRVIGNSYLGTATPLQLGTEVAGLQFEPPGGSFPLPQYLEPGRKLGAADAMLPPGAVRGRQTIIVDEWGPYDYRSPKIWPAGKMADRPLRFRVLGPPGKWEVKTIRGGSSAQQTGVVPGELTITPAGAGLDLTVMLEYVGNSVVTPRGEPLVAGVRVPFSYSVVEPATAWAVKWWTYDPLSDPVGAPEAFARRLNSEPVATETRPRLGFLTSGPIAQGLPADRVAMRAETTVQIPAGGLDLRVLSDDGVRVWVDGALVIDQWSVHDTRVDRVALAAGLRRLRIDYFDAASWAELQVSFVRRPESRNP